MRHKDLRQREFNKKILKSFCTTESSKKKLIKFLQRIERHGQKGHLMTATFKNKSCHEELKEWYESSNLTVRSYTKFLTKVLNDSLKLPKNSEVPINPLDEWRLNTSGYLN
jgi:hypothetical protein